MREIPLTRSLVALVDDEDFDWLNQWRWHAHEHNKGQFHAARYVRTEVITRWGRKYKRLLMHREIMGAPEGMDIDHRDHNELHNWRGNLRICTRSQNTANKERNINNKSGYKGVCRWHNQWRAAVKCQGQKYYLGDFPTKEEAARAYNEAAVQLFGEFAYVNGLTALA